MTNWYAKMTFIKLRKTPLLAILIAFGMSEDGQKIPATMRLFLWLGTSLEDGSSVKFFAAGVMRSEILNGKVLITYN